MDKLIIVLKGAYDLSCVILPVAVAISCNINKSDEWRKKWKMFGMTSGVIGLMLGKFLPNVDIKDYMSHVTVLIIMVVLVFTSLIINRLAGGDGD